MKIIGCFLLLTLIAYNMMCAENITQELPQVTSSRPNFLYLNKVEFAFSNDPIDVIIPCTKKDLDTLERCIEGIKENGLEVRRIIVVSKERLTDSAEWYDESLYPFSVEDIALELLGSENAARSYKENPLNRLGWIYQQLLKLYGPLVIPDISSNVLILDADTVYLNPVSFIAENGSGFFNVGQEYHPPYFSHMNRLLPCLHRAFPQHSGICHNMLFQKCVLEDLINMIEMYHQKPMWKAFLHCIDCSELFGSCASEYEIYFNYAYLRSDQFTMRLLRWENISKLSVIDSYKSYGYHYVSAHTYARLSP